MWLAVLLAPAGALALPEGRHYEMVSPLYKGGYGVNFLEGAAMSGAAEGDRVAFSSLGRFSGEPNNSLVDSYLARRGTSGWSTESMMAPASQVPYESTADLTPALESSLFLGNLGQNNGVAALEGTEAEFLLHGLLSPGEGFAVAGMPLKRLDGKFLKSVGLQEASLDRCHIVFVVTNGSPEEKSEALLAEALGTDSFLYDLASGAPGCPHEPPLRLVGVGNENGPNKEPKVLGPKCLTFLGASNRSEGNSLNAVSSDGRTIFFEVNLGEPPCDGEFVNPSNPAILYARLDGERTIEVSTPVEADCEKTAPCFKSKQERAEFAGADEAGSRVFFVTTQPLVTADADTGKDVYMAEIGCPAAKPGCAVAEHEVTSLTQVSHDPNAGEAAEVQGVSVLSVDGSHVYFVARGALSQEGPGGEGTQSVPVKGADNLYVYDTADGLTHFIADLCSGPGESGVVQDSRCPAALNTTTVNDKELWSGGEDEMQTTGDGRYLVFSTYAQLIASGPQADADSARDVYRYDAQTGLIDRVSVGEGGYDANGNDNQFGAQIPNLDDNGQLKNNYEMASRALSEDGSRIVFESADPLSPKAVNGLVNAYEWHMQPGWPEGRTSLVSSGDDAEPVGEKEGRSLNIAITPSGNDIFFTTVRGLLPQDTDGASDLYDARLGQGFPSVETPRQPCAGDACQGPLTNPAALLVPGSVSQAPGESLVPAADKVAPKKKAKSSKAKRKKRQKGKRASRASRVRGASRRGGGGR